jgi:hypothetical protein
MASNSYQYIEDFTAEEHIEALIEANRSADPLLNNILADMAVSSSSGYSAPQPQHTYHDPFAEYGAGILASHSNTTSQLQRPSERYVPPSSTSTSHSQSHFLSQHTFESGHLDSIPSSAMPSFSGPVVQFSNPNVPPLNTTTSYIPPAALLGRSAPQHQHDYHFNTLRKSGPPYLPWRTSTAPQTQNAPARIFPYSCSSAYQLQPPQPPANGAPTPTIQYTGADQPRISAKPLVTLVICRDCERLGLAQDCNWLPENEINRKKCARCFRLDQKCSQGNTMKAFHVPPCEKCDSDGMICVWVHSRKSSCDRCDPKKLKWILETRR